MKEERIEIRANEEFVEKVDYLQRINDYKNRSDTVRKVVEKEYNKETDFPCLHCVFFDKGKCLNTDGCKYDY